MILTLAFLEGKLFDHDRTVGRGHHLLIVNISFVCKSHCVCARGVRKLVFYRRRNKDGLKDGLRASVRFFSGSSDLRWRLSCCNLSMQEVL